MDYYQNILKKKMVHQLYQQVNSHFRNFKKKKEMNDQNEPVESRYSTIENCDYLIDFALDRDKIRYYDNKNFEKILSINFLDSENSPSHSRAFYNPYWHYKNVYKPYYLLKNKKIKN